MKAKKNILFIADRSSFGYNVSGLASFKTSHLEVLLMSYPEMTINIALVEMWPNLQFEESSLNELRDKYSNFGEVWISETKVKKKPAIYQLLSIRQIARYYSPNLVADLSFIRNIVQANKPELVWAEHIYPALLSGLNSYKYCYSHHDFFSTLKGIKSKSIRSKVESFLLQRLERYVIKKSSLILCGSNLEIDAILKIYPKAQVTFLPTSYELIDKEKLPSANAFEIIHLGSTLATSNKIGLVNFLKEVIPVLNKSGIIYSFRIIGNVNNIIEEHNDLLSQDNVELIGFVEDLNAVFSAYQIHVIPYNSVSGTRTRLTQALNYNHLLLSTYKGSSGFEHLKSNENCILVNDLQEMAASLIDLYHDENRLKRIADQGRLMYEGKFSLKAQVETLKSVIHFEQQ